MKKLNVTERKTMAAGVATELENGKFEVVLEDGTEKTVAASTLKRWYKIENEIIEEEASMENQEIKIGSYAAIEGEEREFVIVVDIAGEIATVLADVDGEVTDKPVKMERLTVVERDEAVEAFEKIEKFAVGNDDEEVTEEPEVEAPKVEAPKAPRAAGKSWDPENSPMSQEEIRAAVAKFIESGIAPVLMKDREVGKIYSGEPKYEDRFDFYGFDLVINYQYKWTSRVRLFLPPYITDQDEMVEEVLIYESPKSSLKDLFEYVGLPAEHQTETKRTIRAQRKYWSETEEEAAEEVAVEQGE